MGRVPHPCEGILVHSLQEEDETNAAQDLGLLRDADSERLMLFQLPPLLPAPPPPRPPDMRSETARRLQPDLHQGAPQALSLDKFQGGKVRLAGRMFTLGCVGAAMRSLPSLVA